MLGHKMRSLLLLVDGPLYGHLEQTIQKIFLPLLKLGTGLPSVKINIASASILIPDILVIHDKLFKIIKTEMIGDFSKTT